MKATKANTVINIKFKYFIITFDDIGGTFIPPSQGFFSWFAHIPAWVQ